MKITFVSHASFLLNANGKTILCDPWLTSKVFNNSWALVSKAMDVDYSKVDYIYISHEHPDHFNFPTLKLIPAVEKARITILYQKHASARLAEAFLKMGFKNIIELPIYAWTEVGGIKLFCGSSGSMDSFLVVDDGKQKLFNLNDCVFNKKQYDYIKSKIGPVDVLFTQFSFANWVGNDSDEVNNAERKISQMREEIEIFKPKFTIPFASFVYFCNAENARMNAWANTPEKIESLKLPGTFFMYPGDSFDTLNATGIDSKTAVDKYMRDINNAVIDPTPETVPFDKVAEAITGNLATFKKEIPAVLRKLAKPFTIHITDLNKTVLIQPQTGTFKELPSSTPARYYMCSQVCWFTFQFSWGSGTLDVSGMYLDKEYPAPHSKYFNLQNLISTGIANFGSFKQIKRTAGFMWAKRGELWNRFV